MANFVSGVTTYTPVGKRQILRSAQPGSYTSLPKTVSYLAYPTEVIDGFTQKVLQEGEVMAVLSSGTHQGKIVPYQTFQADGTTPFTDGRSDLNQLCGICKDYFAAELMDRDVEAGILVRGYLVQAWCTIRNNLGVRVPLTNAVADALRSKKNLDILFS